MGKPPTIGPVEEQLSLSKREHLLISSAYRVLTSQGGHRTSLQDIAKDAGVSKGLLLYHFKSKEAVLATTMRWALLRTADRIRSHIAESTDGSRGMLQALADAIFIGARPNRDFYLLYLDLIEYCTHEHSFGKLRDATQEIMNGLYAEILNDGVAHGRLSIGNVSKTAKQMRAYIDGIFFIWLQDDHWESTYLRYRSMCIDGLACFLDGSARDDSDAHL